MYKIGDSLSQPCTSEWIIANVCVYTCVALRNEQVYITICVVRLGLLSPCILLTLVVIMYVQICYMNSDTVVSRKCAHPYFDQIFCIGFKFPQMSARPGINKLHLLIKHTDEVCKAVPWILCISEVRNFVLSFIASYFKVALCK